MLLAAAVISAVFLILALLALLFGRTGPRILPGLATAAGAVMTIGLFRLLQRNAPHSYDPAAPLGGATAGSIGETVGQAIGDVHRGMTFGKWLAAGAIGAALVAIVAFATLFRPPTPAPVSAGTPSQAVEADKSIALSELKTLHDPVDRDQVNALEARMAELDDKSGEDFEAQGLHDQAIADYTQAISLKSDFAQAYFDRGYAYEAKDLHDQAIADYTQAIALKPDADDAYLNRGVAYGGKGLNDQAIADFTKAIALSPDQALAYYDRGHAFRAKGLNGQAIADFRAALAHDPKLNDARRWLVKLGATP